MKIIHESKLTELFPGTPLTVIVSDEMAKHVISTEVDEVKISDVSDGNSFFDNVDVTITVTDKYGCEEEYITRIHPHLDKHEGEDHFASQHPHLFFKLEDDKSWRLTEEARRGNELLVVCSYDCSAVTYLISDSKNENRELQIPLFEMSEVAL